MKLEIELNIKLDEDQKKELLLMLEHTFMTKIDLIKARLRKLEEVKQDD